MIRQLTSALLPKVALLALIGVIGSAAAPPAATADDLLVFISASAKGEKGAIHAYRLDPAVGKLQPLARTTEIENPFFMALSPDNRFLYAVNAPGTHGDNNDDIFAYELIGRTGKLKYLNRQSSLGVVACSLAVDASGKTVVVANYSSGSVAALPVNSDGSLRKAASFVQHTGSSVDPDRQQGPRAHSIIVSPNNKFVLSADLGLDKVLSYQLDAAAAKLTPATQPFVRTPPGAGPRHLTFHPNGRHLYVINELADTVTTLDYDAATGMMIEIETLSTLPEGVDGQKNWTADLKVTPDGRFLYGTNRGHDSLASYKIRRNGTLKLLNIQPSGGKRPQNLAITPGGELLLCANMGSGEVTVFRIDQSTGALTQIGEPTKQPTPSCIMVR